MLAIFWSYMMMGLFASSAQAVTTGSRACQKSMCVTGMHDDADKTDTYTLELPKGDFGWMAIGFGTSMSNSQMVIVWPDTANGSYVLSQRHAKGQNMPTVMANPSRIASLKTIKSFTNSSMASVTFSIPSSVNNTNATELIWAYAPQAPTNNSGSANFQQHTEKGNLKLAMLTPLDSQGAATTQQSGDKNVMGTGGVKSRAALIAHVVCGALATMLFLPLGVLIPRYTRAFSMTQWWYPVHSAIMGVLGGGLIIASYAIASTSLATGQGYHANLGLALLILICVQIVLGIAIHRAKRFAPAWFKERTDRTPLNYIHLLIGIAVLAMGWVQTYSGIVVQWPQAVNTGPASYGYVVGWAVVVGVVAAAYIAGFALIPRQLRHEQRLHELEKVESPTGSGAPLEKKKKPMFAFRR